MTVADEGAVAAKLAEACLEVVNLWERIASVAAGGDRWLQDLHVAVSVAELLQPADGI